MGALSACASRRATLIEPVSRTAPSAPMAERLRVAEPGSIDSSHSLPTPVSLNRLGGVTNRNTLLSPRNGPTKNATTKSRRTHEECTEGLSSWFRVFAVKNVATTKDAEVRVVGSRLSLL